MTSYELLDFYEEILNEMHNLGAYTDELSELINKINSYQNELLSFIYEDKFHATSGNTANELHSKRDNVIDSVRSFAMNFDTLENHQKLIRAKDTVENVFNKYELGLEEEKVRIQNLLSEYENVTNAIYQYVRTRSNSIIVDLINKVSSIVHEYNKFIGSYENIKYFMSKTENEIEETDYEKILKLHFYDEYLEPEYFALNIHSISESYEIMCQILNVSRSEYPIKVLKIESGSLLGKFLGNTVVIGFLSIIIKKIIELVFNHFTFEGKVLKHKEILDLLKEDADLLLKYKELGIDIEFNEEITKYHYQLIKSIGKMTSKATKVKINNEELYLKDSLKQKYLTEASTLLIEDIKIEKN